ncbi:hypothetical protein MC885_011017, partial [Smutsia gigantea]
MAVIHSGPSPPSSSCTSRPRAPDLQSQCGSVIFEHPDAWIVGPVDHSRLSTCIIIEHPKAVSVMVPKELSCDDLVVPPDHLQ